MSSIFLNLLRNAQEIGKVGIIQVYSNKNDSLKYYKAHPNPDTDSLTLIKLMDQKSFMFIGDIEIRMRSKGSYKASEICRLNFNTSFIPDNK